VPYQIKNVTVGENTTVVKKVTISDNVTLVKKVVVGRPIRRVNSSVSIDNIFGVDTSGKTDGSLLIYNTSSSLWEASKDLEEQIINGGQY